MAADRDLALRIKRARERKGLKQWQLAELIGVNRKTVDNWENARTAPKSSMGALEAALGPLEDHATDPREEALRDLGADRPGGFLDAGEVEQLVARYRARTAPARRAG